MGPEAANAKAANANVSTDVFDNTQNVAKHATLSFVKLVVQQLNPSRLVWTLILESLEMTKQHLPTMNKEHVDLLRVNLHKLNVLNLHLLKLF